MKLTTKQLRRIIKEEMQRVLNENTHNSALKAWKEKFDNEPRAWTSERKQYLAMLRKQGATEEWFLLMEDHMFAGILQHFQEKMSNVQNSDQAKELRKELKEEGLEKIESEVDKYPEFYKIYLEFEAAWWAIARNKFLKLLHEGYLNGILMYHHRMGQPMWALQEVLDDLMDFYYYGSLYKKRFKEAGELISLTNTLVICDASEEIRPRGFEDYRKMIDGGWSSVNWCEDEYDGEF